MCCCYSFRWQMYDIVELDSRFCVICNIYVWWASCNTMWLNNTNTEVASDGYNGWFCYFKRISKYWLCNSWICLAVYFKWHCLVRAITWQYLCPGIPTVASPTLKGCGSTFIWTVNNIIRSALSRRSFGLIGVGTIGVWQVRGVSLFNSSIFLLRPLF